MSLSHHPHQAVSLSGYYGPYVGNVYSHTLNTLMSARLSFSFSCLLLWISGVTFSSLGHLAPASAQFVEYELKKDKNNPLVKPSSLFPIQLGLKLLYTVDILELYIMLTWTETAGGFL